MILDLRDLDKYQRNQRDINLEKSYGYIFQKFDRECPLLCYLGGHLSFRNAQAGKNWY